jgi:adenylate cyclase
MTEPFPHVPEEADAPPPLGAVHPQALPTKGAWERIKEHKVLQWSMAYLGAALALAHGQELVAHAFSWPEVVSRFTIALLAVGFPVAVALAWYHGHRGMTQFSTPEATVVALLVVIAATLLTVLVHAPTEPSNSAATAAPVPTAASGTAPSASAISDKSIAVLPFVDMSEKKDQEYFADGMAEEVIDLLAKVPGIRVIGRTSSFQFAGKSEDLRTIGSTLGAAYVVEGSVRKSGERLRVTAQLIDSQDGSHLWSDSYDENLGDVLYIQDRIAAGLVRALQLSMGADQPGSRPTLKGVEGYSLYLRGRLAFNRYDKQGYDQAASYFRQAMELDPESALAPAWVAYVYWTQARYGFVQPGAANEEARHYAERARALDPRSELATAVLGLIHLEHDWDWAAGAAELDRALALAPGNARILAMHSTAPLSLGQWDAAVRDVNASVALDPLFPAAYNLLGLSHLGAGHWSEAEVAFRRALDIAPNYASVHASLAAALLFRGEKQAALTQIDLEPEEASHWAGRAAINQALGRKADSDAALKRLAGLTSEPNSAYLIACVHAYRGENDAAFLWLERAFTQKEAALWRIKSDPYLNPLKGDPRYKAFLGKMKLPE